MGVHIQFKEVVTLSDETLFTILEIPINEIKRLTVEIVNTVTAFDQFVILGRPNEDADYVTLYNASADFTSPVGVLVGTSGDLTSLGVATGWFIIDTNSLQSLKVQAARASGSNAVVTVQAGGL